LATNDDIEPRRGMPSPKLSREEFRRRYLLQFLDPAFDAVRAELERAADIAWEAYSNSRKAPRTHKAGPEFAHPDYDLSVDWIAARAAIQQAQQRHDDPAAAPRILLVNCSPRSEYTCPGEMSKSWAAHRDRPRDHRARRLLRHRGARPVAGHLGVRAPHLSLQGLLLHRSALCHWPCSCYPNHSLGQVQDWMNDIYPMWVAAHGIMIVTPVHWFQTSSLLKLMIDRLVCADGGNPDPTRTHGKDAKRAKEIEMAGWDYPRHLENRLFAVVVHGDVEGVENVRRAISDWLCYMHLRPAGTKAELDRYIGYWKPHATSHAELDQDRAIQQEAANAAQTLLEAVLAARAGTHVEPGAALRDPRQK
jgi:multimeric flavodoxin WrbA